MTRFACALFFLAASFPTANGTEIGMALTDFGVRSDDVPRFGLFELSFALDREFDNPFNGDAARIEATFIAPSGTTSTVRAFWDREYRSERDGDGERLTPIGNPGWKVRFTPVEIGTYRYDLRVVMGAQRGALRSGRFTVRPSDRHGFIRRSQDFRYLRYDDDTPYFAIGQNLGWVMPEPTSAYRDYFDRMAENGENYARLWMIHWNVALEWTGDGYPPLGRYNLQHAWELDRIFDWAAERGIAIMLCLDSFNALRIRDPYPAYAGNPYAKENGGFLDKPEDFFTDPRAKALYKRRLDYLIARYAYRTNLLAWEFWNEVDIIERYVSEDAVAWHREMADYLRARDPYDHLITTSFANTVGDAAMWRLPQIDLTQSHQYNSRDIAASVREHTLMKLDAFGKPHLFGEFGIDSSGPRPDRDPDGIGLHNGIWASMMSGGAGTAMLWWWDNYVRPKNLYWQFRALANFADGIAWHRLGLRPVSSVVVKGPSDLRLMGLQNDAFAIVWIQNARHTWYRVWKEGPVPPIPPARIEIRGLTDGQYTVEWWDTWKGEVSRRAETDVSGGVLSLETPVIARDAAVKIFAR